MTVSSAADDRPILPGERSGVLHPGNLVRYDAHWIVPDRPVAAVVDQYWYVSWALPDGEALDQRIIDLPAITVTIEAGDVPAPLVVTGVQGGAWRRTIRGRGHVFALRLRPAGLAVLSGLTPEQLADTALPLTEALDPRLHDFLSRIAAQPTPADRAGLADQLIRERLAERPPSVSERLANQVLDELRSRIHTRTGLPLAQQFHVHERTIQRALQGTLGHGPKWISRRIRLQEAALALATRPDDELAVIAAELGYTDQSHLTGDFRAITGITPSRYRQDLARLQGDPTGP